MQMIHEPSDDAILRGWAYFEEWRETRNALFLFDVIAQLNKAEYAWRWDDRRPANQIAERLPMRVRRLPVRREWQLLRRCVMREMEKLGKSLRAAQSPPETEEALYSGGKRATLARIDRLNDRAVTVALVGSTIEEAGATLKGWGIPRTKGTLKKRASQLGLTKRKTKPPVAPQASRKWPTQPAQSPRTVETSPGRRRHNGNAY